MPPLVSPASVLGSGIDPAAEAILRRDPAGVHGRSDPRTQWQYHAVLAEWARHTGREPAALARMVLLRAEAASAAAGSDAPGAHVGHHLLGHGARALEADLGLDSRAAAGPGFAPGLLVPFSAVLAGVLVATCMAFLHRNGAPVWAEVLAVACAVPLASVYASRMVRALPWRRRPGLPLPRLRTGEGLGIHEAVLIVVPAMVPSPARARALVERLRALSEAHPGPEFRFALLSDFPDAAAQTHPGDEATLAELRTGIAALNETGRDGRGDRFFALHRRRTWSATQQAWIGWERKRGKLREAMRLLQSDPPPTTFEWRFGDLPGLLSRGAVPFVITLDESTGLLAGSADELIRTAAHPLNRPVVDAASDRLTSGYTVLQPAVAATTDTPGGRIGGEPASLPGRRQAGLPGFYFRVFDVGLHRGAGALYHAEAFRRAVDGAFPDEVVLHHDLLDGFAGRTGEVSEALVHQPLSRTYLAQTRRGHRWLRGVLQTLPFVLSGSRARHRNRLTGIQRWFVAELALAEVSTLASLVFLLLAWTVLPGSPLVWTLLACPALPVVAGSVFWRATVLRRRPGGTATLGRAAAGLFAQVVLVHQSAVAADALARVAWRLGVSRRNLLEWAPRHEHDSRADTPLSAYWRAMWMSPVAGAAVLAGVATWRPAVLWIAAPFALAWIAAPAIVGLGDRHLFGARGRP